jgi:hypothetical protein
MLSGLPPQICEIVADADPRAQNFARELHRALSDAGWRCTNAGVERGNAAPISLHVPRASPPAATLLNWARRLGFNPEFRVDPSLRGVRIGVGVLRPE